MKKKNQMQWNDNNIKFVDDGRCMQTSSSQLISTKKLHANKNDDTNRVAKMCTNFTLFICMCSSLLSSIHYTTCWIPSCITVHVMFFIRMTIRLCILAEKHETQFIFSLYKNIYICHSVRTPRVTTFLVYHQKSIFKEIQLHCNNSCQKRGASLNTYSHMLRVSFANNTI